MKDRFVSKKTLYTSERVIDYGIPIVLILCMTPSLLEMFRMANNLPYSMPLVNYFVGYETGFGGRKLIGTLMHFVLPDYIELRHLRLVILGINIVMVALFVEFVRRKIKSDRNDLSLWILLATYLISPFSILKWMSVGLSASFMETYLIILTLTWLMLYERRNNSWLYYVVTIIITIVGCLIHHTFCCTFFPIFVALFAYEIWDNGFSSKKMIIYGGICLLMAIILLVIWCYSTMNIDIEVLADIIEYKTSSEVFSKEKDLPALQLLYYITNTENWSQAFSYTPYRFHELAISLVLLSPLFYLFYAPWIISFVKSKGLPNRYKYFLPPILLTFITLPVFFVATDYSRWFVAWFFGLFAISWVLLCRKDVLFAQCIKQVFSKQMIITCIVVYSSQLHMAYFAGLQEAIIIRPHLFP